MDDPVSSVPTHLWTFAIKYSFLFRKSLPRSPRPKQSVRTGITVHCEKIFLLQYKRGNWEDFSAAAQDKRGYKGGFLPRKYDYSRGIFSCCTSMDKQKISLLLHENRYRQNFPLAAQTFPLAKQAWPQTEFPSCWMRIATDRMSLLLYENGLQTDVSSC